MKDIKSKFYPFDNALGGFLLNFKQGDEVGGSNTAACAQKLSCKACELDQTVDSDIL